MTSTDPRAAPAPQPVVSLSPVTLPAPHRGEDLRVRVSAPATGQDLPILVFSHGFGSSLHAYGPLADYWAARGFVVLQPTFLDSRTSSTSTDQSRLPRWWRDRVEDVKRILDELPTIEAAVPGLAGRLDTTRIAAAGHSFGGQTTGVLLGLRVGGAEARPGPDLSDPRVKAGVLLATAGEGGEALQPGVAEQLPWLVNPDFSTMSTPSLIVYGDADVNPLTTRGAEWGTEPYLLGPGAQHLVTLVGAEHSLGGIPGYEAAETTDENPRRVAAVARLSWAFLRSTLYPGDTSWDEAKAEFAENFSDLGRIESR